MLNNLQQMHLKLLQTKTTTTTKKIQDTAEIIGDLIGNKIAHKITEVSTTSPDNNSQTVTNRAENIAHNKGIPKERYISPQKRQKIIDDLRLI